MSKNYVSEDLRYILSDSGDILIGTNKFKWQIGFWKYLIEVLVKKHLAVGVFHILTVIIATSYPLGYSTWLGYILRESTEEPIASMFITIITSIYLSLSFITVNTKVSHT